MVEYNYGDCENRVEDLELDLKEAEELLKRVTHKDFEDCDADICKDITKYLKG